MPITDRQLTKKTEALTLEFLKRGRVPSARDLFFKLRDFMKQTSGGPSFYPRYQSYRKVWDYKATNLGFQDLRFDLEVGYEEAVSQTAKMLRRLALVELGYTSQKTSIEILIGALRNLLFVTKDADDNFFGVFDTFNDLSKVDQINTTRDAVDLNEGVVLLPQGDLTSSRVDMSHLYTKASWPVFARSLGAPSAPQIPQGNPGPPQGALVKPSRPGGVVDVLGQVVQNEVAPGSHFGNAFADFINSWRQIVTTNNPGGAQIEFTVPIGPNPEQEITITRIAIMSGSANDISLKVFKSTDNINFTRFPGVPDEVILKPGKVTSVDFESTRVQFIRFQMKLMTYTVQEGASFGYLFGIRNISFYKVGRTQQAEFRSKALIPSGMTDPIDRVAISTTETIPGECSIEWYVAAADTSGGPRDGIWHAINPLSREPRDVVPQIIRFGNLSDRSIRLPATSPALPYDTVRNIDYYRLTEDPLTEDPKFGTVSLWRGNNAWTRNKTRTAEVKEIRDAFIDFNPGDTQNLYAVATEIPDVESELSTTQGEGRTQTALTVENAIDYDVSTMSLIPPPLTDSETDQRPRYAIYKVERFRDTMVIENESVDIPDDDSWVSLANTGVQALGGGRPVVTNEVGSVTYLEGRDYVLEVDPDTVAGSPVLTGRLKRRPNQSGVSNSNISNGQTVKVSYMLQSDITYLVDAARGNKVFLKKDLGNVGDQYFQVTYRFVPRPPLNTIRKSTLRVSSTYGNISGGIEFAEGPDYLLDAVQGTITRVPGGRIQGTLHVFVDFQYEQQAPELDTFTTWVRVDRRDPTKVEFNPLGINIDAGERVWVDGRDVSRLTEFPEMLFGWHQVVVKSLRPESYDNAAVNLVSALFDRTSEPIFLSGGKYFAEMVASREPMIQRTYTQLTKGTPVADHTYFAVTSDRHVVVNFEPSTTEDVYTYGLRRGPGGTVTADSWPEEFWLQYQYINEQAEPVRKVLVRAILNRASSVDGGVSPRIHEYHLRAA